MNKTILLKEIEKAFPLRPLPDVIAGNVTPYEDEYSYVEKYFKGKEWNSFTFKELYVNYQGPQDACLAFMSTAAFHYYLPGFMCIVINEYNEADLLVDTTLYSLAPAESESNSVKFDRFTQKQRKAIINFITYLSEVYAEDFFENEISSALSYWNNKSGSG
ncbi:MAG TPA: hypothetical protein ENJ08_05035 [Gammaproteobacteria bacterium]|nr:hypothetical protein [Gammaproteobacteria bacterium]